MAKTAVKKAPAHPSTITTPSRKASSSSGSKASVSLGAKTTPTQYTEILEWFGVEENFALINGAAGHGKSMGSGVKMKIVDGYRALANHMNHKFHTTWDHHTAKNRFTAWKSKYLSTKAEAERTGFGLTEKEIDSGMTLDDKLDSKCFMFHDMDKLFGHRANVVPMHVSQTPLPESENNNSDNDNSDIDDKFDEATVRGDRSAVGGNNENDGGNDGGNDPGNDGGNDGGSNGGNNGVNDDKMYRDVELRKLPEPMPLPNLTADVHTAGSTKQKRKQTGSKKGKVAAAESVVDLSSDSDLDSASAVTKKSRPNSASSTRTSFATSYVESQAPKLELMAKSLIERTKSAEATLQLQRDELALKREISEQEYMTRRLENLTKLKAEQNAMLKILLESGMSFADAKKHVDEAFE